MKPGAETRSLLDKLFPAISSSFKFTSICNSDVDIDPVHYAIQSFLYLTRFKLSSYPAVRFV